MSTPFLSQNPGPAPKIPYPPAALAGGSIADAPELQRAEGREGVKTFEVLPSATGPSSGSTARRFSFGLAAWRFLPRGLWSVPDDPFYQPRARLWWPEAMRVAPALEGVTAGPMERRFVLLVNPFYAKDPHGSFGKHVLTPTLALTSLAAATPSDWRVAYWDENLLQGPAPLDPLPQVVGISVHLTFASRAYALARWFRQHGCTVILGGLHVISCPEEAAPHADALCLGDGGRVWPQILREAERGTLQPRYVAGFDGDYALDPPARRDLIPSRLFLTTASIIATRGCRSRCGFCYLATDGLRLPRRLREPRQVAQELAAQGEPYAVFIDNNLAADPDYLRRLCHELKPIEKIWSAAVTLDVTDDPALVREMALSGCTGVFIGFESLSDGNLARAHKRTPRTAEYARRVQVFHDHGIAVNGSFVVGFDEDTAETFSALAEWIESNRLECATFHILTPYPGTPLFRQFEREGRLLHCRWDLYDTAHVVFRPKHLTPEQLALGYDWLYRRLFSLESIWRRRPRGTGALLSYLVMSGLYKRSNRLWYWLIRRQLVHALWAPFVHASRWRHLRLRAQLAQAPLNERRIPTASPIPAGS